MIKQRCISIVFAMYLILGTWKGYVALFQDGNTEPRQIFPTPVSSLPKADQESLTQGILIRSEQKLQQLLEDYLS